MLKSIQQTFLFLSLFIFIVGCNTKKKEDASSTKESSLVLEENPKKLDTAQLENTLNTSLSDLKTKSIDASYTLQKKIEGVEGKSTEKWIFDSEFNPIVYSEEWYEAISEGSRQVWLQEQKISKLTDSVKSDGLLNKVVLINTSFDSIQGLSYILNRNTNRFDKNLLDASDVSTETEKLIDVLKAEFSKIKEIRKTSKKDGSQIQLSVRLEGIPESYGKFYETYLIDTTLFDHITSK